MAQAYIDRFTCNIIKKQCEFSQTQQNLALQNDVVTLEGNNREYKKEQNLSAR